MVCILRWLLNCNLLQLGPFPIAYGKQESYFIAFSLRMSMNKFKQAGRLPPDRRKTTSRQADSFWQAEKLQYLRTCRLTAPGRQIIFKQTDYCQAGSQDPGRRTTSRQADNIMHAENIQADRLLPCGQTLSRQADKWAANIQAGR
jgi:hypothetical protein